MQPSDDSADEADDDGAGVLQQKRSRLTSKVMGANNGGSCADESTFDEDNDNCSEHDAVVEPEEEVGDDDDDEEAGVPEEADDDEEPANEIPGGEEPEEAEETEEAEASTEPAQNRAVATNATDDGEDSDDGRGMASVARRDASKAQPLARRPPPPPAKAVGAQKRLAPAIPAAVSASENGSKAKKPALVPKAAAVSSASSKAPAIPPSKSPVSNEEGETQQAIVDSDPSDNEEPHRTVGVQRPKVAPEHFDAVVEAENARKQSGHAPAAAAQTTTDGSLDPAIADGVTFVLLGMTPGSAAIVPKADLVHAVAVDDDGNQLEPFEVPYSKEGGGLRAAAMAKKDLARKLLQNDGKRMLRSVILCKVAPQRETPGKQQVHMQALLPVKLAEGECDKDPDCKSTLEQIEKNLPDGHQLVLAIEESIVKEMYKIHKHGLPTKYAPSDSVKYWTVKNVQDQIKLDSNWILCARGGAAGRASGSGSATGKRKGGAAKGATNNNTNAANSAASGKDNATPAAAATATAAAAIAIAPRSAVGAVGNEPEEGSADAADAATPAPQSKRAKGASGARQRAGQPMLTEMGVTNGPLPGPGSGGVTSASPPPLEAAPIANGATARSFIPTEQQVSVDTDGQIVLNVSHFPVSQHALPNTRTRFIKLSEPGRVHMVQADPQHICLLFVADGPISN